MADARTGLFVRKQVGGMFHIEDMSRSTGARFFVHSGTGTDGAGYGRNPDSPTATIDFAVGLCTANQNDIIYVMPGHAETLTAAAQMVLDVAGISVIGLGNGTDKPTITMGTAETTDVDIDAVSIYVSGLRFVSAIDDLEVMLDVNFGSFVMENCDFVSGTATEVVNFINIATTKDDFLFKGCTFYQPTDPDGTDDAAATGCFYFVDSELIRIEDCFFNGFFETSIFHNKTTAATRLWIKNCWGNQELAGADSITLVDNATGGMADCRFTQINAADVAEGTFMTIAATTPFGFFNTFFMNDNGGGGNLALAITAATT